MINNIASGPLRRVKHGIYLIQNLARIVCLVFQEQNEQGFFFYT